MARPPSGHWFGGGGQVTAYGQDGERVAAAESCMMLLLGARLTGVPKPWPGGLVAALPAYVTTNDAGGVTAIFPNGLEGLVAS
jgi:hypothetical protein